MTAPVRIVGGGLAGAECAYQLATRGIPAILDEMRPHRTTPAHKTGRLAELVCSNSLRSDDPSHPAGLLKREMECFGSLIVAAARQAAVPAGSALAVDRFRFADSVTSTLQDLEHLELRRREVTEIPQGDVVLATGPLTSEAMSEQLAALLGSEHLYFYDAIAPIVDADSLDMTKLFWGSRYGKGGEDYLNAPMSRQEYLAFHRELVEAEVVPLHDSEKSLYFEGCLPAEEMARRGIDTLRYGPLKPVGLEAPDGRQPYAVVQLRPESLSRRHLNLVGCQTRLRWPEQKRVFRLIPGLEQADFVRLGQIHRNTFVNAPLHLDRFYRVRSVPRVRLAGQITGVEGYLESAATGLVIALYLFLERQGRTPEALPATTALGALARHLTESNPKHFQPANINFGLFTDLRARLPKRRRRQAYVERSWRDLEAWAAAQSLNWERSPKPSASLSEEGGSPLICAS